MLSYKNLYRIIGKDGGVTITPLKPNEEAVPSLIRIIADTGKAITKDDVTLYSCKDEQIINDIETTLAGWYEIDMPINGYESTIVSQRG